MTTTTMTIIHPTRSARRVLLTNSCAIRWLCLCVYLFAASSTDVVVKALELDHNAATAELSPESVLETEGEEKPALPINTEEELELEIMRETIEAGRGDRDEQGIRDQWNSDEHLGETTKFDTRKPISNEVKRLLNTYRLECEGCDHAKAAKKVNKYVRETKHIAKLEKEERKKQEQRDFWVSNTITMLLLAGMSYVYVNRKRLQVTWKLWFGEEDGYDDDDDDGLSGFTEAQRSEIMRLRREHAAAAASKRQTAAIAAAAVPTWLDNERKEIWTPKQEKKFQKALREFGGVNKKERYQLISAQVDGKSRIECLTHHRMQDLLERQQQ